VRRETPPNSARVERREPQRNAAARSSAAAREELGEVCDERTCGVGREDALLGRVEELETRVRAPAKEAAEQREPLLVEGVAVERRRRDLDLQEVRELRELRKDERRLAEHAVQQRRLRECNALHQQRKLKRCVKHPTGVARRHSQH
jgi:hypothetical protein